MTEIPKLTPAQKAAIYPGPGNPEYAQGRIDTMEILRRMNLVSSIDHWTTNGKRGAKLTEAGARVREQLAAEAKGND